MIPAGKKFVPYTYKSFSREDLKIDPSLDIKSVDNMSKLNNIDTVDYGHFNSIEDFNKSSIIEKYFKLYSDDICDECLLCRHYYLNEIGIKYNIDTIYFGDVKDTKEYRIKYTMIDNKSSDINIEDNRCLDITVYHDLSFDNSTLTKIYQVRVKLDHLYQLYMDIDKIKLSKDNCRHVNLYVLPLYIRFFENKEDKFIRISDYMYNYFDSAYANDDTYMSALDYIFNLTKTSLKLYMSTNFLLASKIEEYENTIVEEDTEVVVSSSTGKKSTRKATKSVQEPKDRIIAIDDILNSKKKIIKKVYNRISKKHINKPNYRYSVRGHYHNYWVGSGDNKRLIRKWVESYYKNPNSSDIRPNKKEIVVSE